MRRISTQSDRTTTAASGAGVHDPGYPATVKASHAYENSYDLEYDDGDAESRVPARYVRPLATAAPTPLTTTSQAPPGGEL